MAKWELSFCIISFQTLYLYILLILVRSTLLYYFTLIVSHPSYRFILFFFYAFKVYKILASTNTSKYNDQAHFKVYYDFEADQICMEKLNSLLLEPSRYFPLSLPLSFLLLYSTALPSLSFRKPRLIFVLNSGTHWPYFSEPNYEKFSPSPPRFSLFLFFFFSSFLVLLVFLAFSSFRYLMYLI